MVVPRVRTAPRDAPTLTCAALAVTRCGGAERVAVDRRAGVEGEDPATGPLGAKPRPRRQATRIRNQCINRTGTRQDRTISVVVDPTNSDRMRDVL